MNHGRLSSWVLIASLFAAKAAYAQPADPGEGSTHDDSADDDDDKADVAPAPAAKAEVKASTPAASPIDSAPAKEPEAAAPALSPVMSRWGATLYGFIELDGMHDSTQSYGDGSNGASIARRGTYGGDRGQTQATIKNSRIGLKLDAPDYHAIKSSAVIEMDFFGVQPTDVTQNDFYVLGTMRVRHAYVKLQTPVVDLLAGQYHDLYGWGGSGFYPNSVAFLGLPGQIYHRNPQIRLSKVLGGDAVSFEIAAAAVRPAQRHSETPDGQAGIKLSLNNWKGAASQGSGQPQLTPFAIGGSVVGRRFVIPQFIGQPRSSRSATGWGVAANAVIPVIPVKDIDDRANALTLTAEGSTGTGVSDLYTGTTGGAKFPELPNPGAIIPPLVYPQNVDPGIVTFDADLNAKTYQWTGFVVGAQYYLPISGGKVWVSGNYAQMSSNNILTLTPAASWGAVYKSARYYDANVFVAVTPATQLAASFQVTSQTYGDGSKPTNMRSEVAALFFF